MLERLESRRLLAADFGDAPLPYSTLLAENGAEHVAIGPMLGADRDMEADGAHTTAADGDDITGSPDDEDGVAFGLTRVGNVGATVTVTVSGGPAKLDAWIDFNRDGAWGGPLEQIADRVSVNTGSNIISFDVPSSAADGLTYARFRLSTAGNLGPKGPSADGEVEDYALTIQPPQAACGCFKTSQNITTGADGATSVYAVDVDRDGDMDVLSASYRDDKIAWYENDGNQSFTAHTVSTTPNLPVSVHAADLDGDGDIDVLSASVIDDRIAWYENDGNQNFTPRIVSSTTVGAWGVSAADVDGDGDIDVLSAALIDDKITWHENDGNQNFTAHAVTSTANGAQSVQAADVDGDGDMDLLSASYFDNKIAWYENDGSQSFTLHAISTAAHGASSVFPADVDGDGDMDALSASTDDDKIAWYENDGSQNFTSHVITTSADGAYNVYAADIDGDGDTDALSASFIDNKIAWYENDGSQNFTTRVITTSAEGAYSVYAADIDGDGDIDVVSASAFDDKVAWYENRLALGGALETQPENPIVIPPVPPPPAPVIRPNIGGSPSPWLISSPVTAQERRDIEVRPRAIKRPDGGLAPRAVLLAGQADAARHDRALGFQALVSWEWRNATDDMPPWGGLFLRDAAPRG
jgi:hypothetical protein